MARFHEIAQCFECQPQTQDLVGFTPRVGSIPSSGIPNLKQINRFPRSRKTHEIENLVRLCRTLTVL